MARSRFGTRGVKSRKAVPLHLDNAPPLGSRPGIKMSEPGQDAEASDYPSQPSRKGRRAGERTAPGGSGSIGIKTTGKGRAGK